MKKILIFIVPAVAIITILGLFLFAVRTPDPAETTRPEPGEIRVRLTDDLRFIPARVEVEVGQTVVWVNESEKVHTVTTHPESAIHTDHASAPRGSEHFGSGNLGPGQTFKRTFTVAGVYKYYCHPHQDMAMRGEIVVFEPGQQRPPEPVEDGAQERARHTMPGGLGAGESGGGG